MHLQKPAMTPFGNVASSGQEPDPTVRLAEFAAFAISQPQDMLGGMNTATAYHRLNAANAHLLEAVDIFDNRVDPEQLAKFQADNGHELVFAMSGDVVVGFASGTVLLHPDKLPAFFVNEVDVASALRRQGIGTALCRMLIEIARNRGCRGIWLATEEENVAARALYRGLDARETSAIVVYDWDGAMDM